MNTLVEEKLSLDEELRNLLESSEIAIPVQKKKETRDEIIKFEMKTKNGIAIRVTSDNAHILAKGRSTDIELHKINEVLLSKSAIDLIRFENTVTLNLDCGRIITIKRVPLSKTGVLENALLGIS